MVDQEPNINDVISFTKADGRKYVGTLNEDLITVPGAGLMEQPWFGKIDKTDETKCVHEKLDEYCKHLGLLDDEIVKGERFDCEEMKHARLDGNKWSCFKSLLEGDDSATSATCVDNDGEAVLCTSADASDDTCRCHYRCFN